MRIKFLTTGLLLACACAWEVRSATWYAAANGSSTNGTYTQPWSVPYSVTNTNPHLQPGDTVLFKPGGPYVCNEYWPGYMGTNRLGFRKSGTPSAKITYRSLELWKFSFDGNLFLPTTSSNIIIHGFRIFTTDTTNRNNYGDSVNHLQCTHPSGSEAFGPGLELLHNLFENNGGPGIGSSKLATGKHIAGNIIRFAGNQDFTADPPSGITNWNGARRGSGIYAANLNNSDEALIEGNIIYFNYTESIYMQQGEDLWNFNCRNNVCVPATYGLFYDLRSEPSQGVKMTSNYVWAAKADGIVDVAIGLGTDRTHDGGGTNVIVAGNYLVAGNKNLVVVDGWKQLTVTNNTIVHVWDSIYDAKPWIPLIWQLGGALNTNDYVHSYTFDYNTYYVRKISMPDPFMYFESNVLHVVNFTNWQAVQGEANSTYTVGLPTNVLVKAFVPSTDSNFVHVAVFNWPTNATTSVDLSGYFTNGSELAVYDAQNIPTAYTNFTYAGGSVALDLTRTNIAEMWGTFTNPPMTWTGFDPRFRAFVVYNNPNQFSANVSKCKMSKAKL